MPPIVLFALGALAAGAIVHRRINAELDRVKEGAPLSPMACLKKRPDDRAQKLRDRYKSDRAGAVPHRVYALIARAEAQGACALPPFRTPSRLRTFQIDPKDLPIRPVAG
jgi:hypothetical protein